MATFKSYLTGFILSVALTLAAYFAVINYASHAAIIILILALAQLVVQLIYFLHLGQGANGHWNLTALFSTISIILILVVGSLWIMNHLNYNMSPDQMNNYLLKEENLQK